MFLTNHFNEAGSASLKGGWLPHNKKKSSNEVPWTNYFCYDRNISVNCLIEWSKPRLRDSPFTPLDIIFEPTIRYLNIKIIQLNNDMWFSYQTKNWIKRLTIKKDGIGGYVKVRHLQRVFVKGGNTYFDWLELQKMSNFIS